MNTRHNYLGFLADSVTRMVRDILKEDGLSFFRKSPQVVFGSPEGVSPDFHLCLLGQKGLSDDKGTFNSLTAEDKFLVFRNPVRLQVSFSLVGYGLPSGTRLRAEDRLTTFFFDHKTIDPFVPGSYQEFPALYQRLMGQRAELKVSETSAPSPLERFTFNFDYLALYHSGNPLREELKTKQRVIEYGNDRTERSLT